MTLKIKNTTFWEWDVPKELAESVIDGNYSSQDLVDEYFNEIDVSVTEVGDHYYEAHEVADL